MKLLRYAGLFAALAVTCHGQGFRFDTRVTTVATNVPTGASAPVLAYSKANIKVCTTSACSSLATIYLDQALTVPTSSQFLTDTQGRFGFWAATGTYWYQVSTTRGVIGTYPVTLGGSGGGGAGSVTNVGGGSPLFAVSNPTTTPSLNLQNAAAHTVFGNNTGSSALPSFFTLTYSDISGSIPLFGASNSGAVPSSGGGTNNFLRADGSWAPATGGGATFPGTPGIVYNTSGLGSRNATSSDVISTFGGGACVGFLKSDGNCGSTPGISGLTVNKLPLASTSTSLADSHIDDGFTSPGKVTITEPLVISSSGNGMAAVEGTAPSGIASSDVLWPDSTAHRFVMNNNNTGAVNVVGVSAPASPGNIAVFAANGYDVVDGGAGGGLNGSANPKGVTCTAAGQYYTQTVTSGTPQPWVCSTHKMVWTNLVTGEVVYAGPATMYTTGFSQCLEMNEGTGTTTADACGHSVSTLGGSGASPSWNGTNGLNFPGGQYTWVQLSNISYLQHSTYLICLKSTAFPSGPLWTLGNTAINTEIAGLDAYGSLTLGGKTGVASLQTSLQPITSGTGACITYVYNGAGNDRFYIGSAPLSIKNPGSSLTSVTLPAGLGVAFNGTMYKFYAIEGTELAEDYIQHNALIESERVAAAASISVPGIPSGWYAGSMGVWYVGDSRVNGNGLPTLAPSYYINQGQKIPGFSLYNGGTAAQQMVTYVNGGIFTQAPNFLKQISIPSSGTAPPHIMIQAMGINDFNTGATAATVYAAFTTAMNQSYGSGWKTDIETIYQATTSSAGADTQRLAYNALLVAGGLADTVVDIANDPHFTDRTGTLDYSKWGNFSPYYADGLHPTALGSAVIAGRHLNAINRLGFIGAGRVYTVSYAANLVIDLSKGDTQDIRLTGNVASFKVINYNQGERFTLNFIQDGTGGRTVAYPTIGSGATGTTTSGGVVTLTGGGTLYDQNYEPTIYTAGLTCSTYPRYSSTIAAGVITSITQVTAGSGCSGSGTVQFLSSEPVWHGTMSVTTTANTVTSQSFTIDALGQNIYAVNQTAQ